MIELIIIAFIGKQFHQLAKKYKQNLSWIYFIVGIVTYYGGAFVGSFILLLIGDLAGLFILEELSDLALMGMAIPLGALACWGMYVLLKRKWYKEYLLQEQRKPRISDIGKSQEEIDAELSSIETKKPL